MTFSQLPLAGAFLIDLEPRQDERGFFARGFCRAEFEAHGLESEIVQANISFNHHRGTLRGIHYQVGADAEVKMVRCTRGAVFDVIVDLRPDSPTCGHWFGTALSASNRRMMYVPRGFGHGYQTLEDESEVFYMVTTAYAPGHEGGYRWDDPAFGIDWPIPEPNLSPRDLSHPPFRR